MKLEELKRTNASNSIIDCYQRLLSLDPFLEILTPLETYITLSNIEQSFDTAKSIADTIANYEMKDAVAVSLLDAIDRATFFTNCRYKEYTKLKDQLDEIKDKFYNDCELNKDELKEFCSNYYNLCVDLSTAANLTAHQILEDLDKKRGAK